MQSTVTLYEQVIIEKLSEIIHAANLALGPRELCVLRAEAIPLIYGNKSECRKSTFYGLSGNNPKQVSINNIRDRNSYRLRRRVWDRGLSTKCKCTMTKTTH